METLAVTPSTRAASADVFAAAAIELCARLWAELDRLCATLETDDAHELLPWLATRVEVLRLELTIILERCANRWTTQFDQRQIGWLETIMEDLLDSLDASADELPGYHSIASAQNRLLSAILEQCAEHSDQLIEIPMHGSDLLSSAGSRRLSAGISVHP
jgi:hypothetical protein